MMSAGRIGPALVYRLGQSVHQSVYVVNREVSILSHDFRRHSTDQEVLSHFLFALFYDFFVSLFSAPFSVNPLKNRNINLFIGFVRLQRLQV
jgi:hypothetical protein